MMGNSPYECFIGTEVWYRDSNGNPQKGIVRSVQNETFVIRIRSRRFGKGTMNVNIKDVFDTKESMLADEYKGWKSMVAECMEQTDSPEKILRVLYAQASSGQAMSDEMCLAIRKQTKDFFGIELDEKAAAREKVVEELLGEG